MGKKSQSEEIIERYFFAESAAGRRYYAGKSVFTENSKDVLLKIGNETFIGYQPKQK